MRNRQEVIKPDSIIRLWASTRPLRMKYKPVPIKTALVPLRKAFSAGKKVGLISLHYTGSQPARHQAAGFVVRRLATRNDSANITSVNSDSTAKLAPSERPVEADPAKSSERKASVP